MWECRFCNCWNSVERGRSFCPEHAEYDSLATALFNGDKADGSYYEMEPLTGVYVIGNMSIGAVKVGIARDVLSRISSIQTGFPLRLDLFSVVYTDRKSAEKLERESHKRLTEFGFHLNGEWFDSDPDDTIALVVKCAKNIGVQVLSIYDYSGILGKDNGPIHNVRLGPVMRRIMASEVSAMAG